MKRAVFLDRDGTINADTGYVCAPQQVRLLPGVGRAIAMFKDAGYLVVVVSNQSALARGMMDEAGLKAVEQELVRQLAQEGTEVDAWYYCPHLPEGVVKRYTMVCDCRKPAPGLVLQAARELDIDLSASVLVGDSPRDIACAVAAGVGRSIFLGSAPCTPEPTAYAPNLLEAARLILEGPA